MSYTQRDLSMSQPVRLELITSKQKEKPIAGLIDYLQTVGNYDLYRKAEWVLPYPYGRVLVNCVAVHQSTGKIYLCKVMALSDYRHVSHSRMIASTCLDMVPIQDIITGPSIINQISNNLLYVIQTAPQWGDVYSECRKQPEGMKEEIVRSIFTQLVHAVLHIHAHGMVFGELKLKGLIYQDASKIKIYVDGVEQCQFPKIEEVWVSVSGQLCNIWMAQISGTHTCPAYVAPEILSSIMNTHPGKENKYCGRCADSWCLGVILASMLYGRYPFADRNASALYAQIQQVQYIIKRSVNPAATDVITSLLKKDPLKRISPSQILKMPWMRASGNLVCFITLYGISYCLFFMLIK